MSIALILLLIQILGGVVTVVTIVQWFREWRLNRKLPSVRPWKWQVWKRRRNRH